MDEQAKELDMLRSGIATLSREHEQLKLASGRADVRHIAKLEVYREIVAQLVDELVRAAGRD